MQIRHLNQKQLAQRWQVSEACLERWRHEKIGPDYLKLHCRILYRQQDIEAFELRCLKTMQPQADSASS